MLTVRASGGGGWSEPKNRPRENLRLNLEFEMRGIMMNKTKRARLWLVRAIIAFGIVIGLALVFNEQIKLFVIDQMSQSTMKHIDRDSIGRNNKAKANFKFSAVKALDAQTVSAAVKNNDVHAIGKLAVPSVDLNLPISKGLDNDNLSVGAGTMKADQQMGVGNYALAGHYMTNKGILFSPLKQVTEGDKIYLTDMQRVFTYRVTTKTTISDTQVHWIDDVPGKKLVTLITCASATEGEVDRIVVQGSLVSVATANKRTLEVFN